MPLPLLAVAAPMAGPAAAASAKFIAKRLVKETVAKNAAKSAAGMAESAGVRQMAQRVAAGQSGPIPVSGSGGTRGSKMFMYGIGLFLAVCGLLIFLWLFGVIGNRKNMRQLAPEKVMNISRRENGTAEHREYMFKKSHRNSYMKERSTAMGPGGQSATELGGFFGMKAPGAVLGQAPMGAPIKPPVIGNTISTEPMMSAGGVLIDTAAEEELEHEMQTYLENKTAQRISKRARSNKVLGENNTGHSEQISELIASTTLASGNDFLRPFGQNSARYSGRNVQSRYIEPRFKDDVPNMN